MKEASSHTEDQETLFALGARLVQIEPGAGRAILVGIMESAEAPVFRNDALTLLKEQSGDDFGFDPMDDPSSDPNRAALVKWKEWLREKVTESR